MQFIVAPQPGRNLASSSSTAATDVIVIVILILLTAICCQLGTPGYWHMGLVADYPPGGST